MVFDPIIAERIREAVASEPDVSERKMFGGLAFLLRGNMAMAASSKGGLMIRTDPATASGLVDESPAEYVEMSGRQLQGWLHLGAVDIESDHQLAIWINRALDYATTLPSKS